MDKGMEPNMLMVRELKWMLKIFNFYKEKIDPNAKMPKDIETQEWKDMVAKVQDYQHPSN